jgi:3-hydroxyisobutyrate dehydrogenase
MIAFILQNDWEALGTALIRRLAVAGHEVTVFVRNDQRNGSISAKLPAEVTLAKSLAAAIAEAKTVVTLLSTPQEVEEVYLGEGGIFECAAPESLFIDLSTSNPRLAKELYALAAVHDHGFVEAPFGGDVEGLEAEAGSEAGFEADEDGEFGDEGVLPAAPTFSLYAASEPDNMKQALPLLHVLAPRVVNAGLPGSGITLKLASQIALANALMGVVEAIAFAAAVGVEGARVLETLNESAAASVVARAFGQKMLDEEFYYGVDLHLFYNDLAAALETINDLGLALPGLETAHQLYDLLVLVGGGNKGIHALALIYCDEARCAAHGLNWELAQRAMDVYERASDVGDDDYDDDYDYDDEECDDPDCRHPHHVHHYFSDDGPPSMGDYFSSN